MRHFNTKFDKILSLDDTLSCEVIAYQKDDGFASKLDGIFADLGFTTDGPHKALASDKEIKLAAEDLSELITARTGMNISVINSENGNMFTWPIVLDITSTLMNYSKDTISYIETHNDEFTDDEYKKLDKYTKGFYHFSKNMKQALKDKRLQDLSVDLDRARVNNLPKEYVGTIFIDFKSMHNLGLTNREAVAILLHEVGHNFTSIETTYRTVLNSTIILDSIIESVKSGKAPGTGLIKGYEKLYKEKVPPDTPLDKVFMSILEIENKKIKIGAEQDMNYTIDSERVADLFASRMGYAVEIVSALNKIGPSIGNSFLYFIHAKLSVVTGMSLWAIIGYGICHLLGLTIFGLWSAILLPFVYVIFKEGKTEYDDNTQLTYDGYYNRFLKMKLDMIRVIRTDSNLDMKYKKRILDNLETLDNLLKDLPRPSETIFLKIHKLLSTRKQRLFDMKRSEQLIEQLQENDLWTASNKIQQFI